MWQAFRAEDIPLCIDSLRQLQQLNLTRKDDFLATGYSEDKVLADALLGWANECDEAVKAFQRAVEHEKIGRKPELDSEFVMRARDEIPAILGPFRARTYPTIEMRVELLDAKSPVRQQAEEKVTFGKTILIKDYGVKASEFAAPDWQV